MKVGSGSQVSGAALATNKSINLSTAAASTGPAAHHERLLLPIVERPWREKFKDYEAGCQRHSSGRILEWVSKLERINSNLDAAHTPSPIQQQQQQQPPDGRQTRPAGLGAIEFEPAAKASHQQTGAPGRVDVDGDEDGEQDLCLRASQLVTEFLLMIFAAGLLLIVAIVILSRRVPEFMDSYEIVPKFFFFLCVFVAAYSFVRWLVVELHRKYEKKSVRKGRVPMTSNGRARQLEVDEEEIGAKLPISKVAGRHEARASYQAPASMRPNSPEKRHTDSPRPLPEAPGQPHGFHVSPLVPHHQTGRKLTRAGQVRGARSARRPAPTRQAALDAPASLLVASCTIREEEATNQDAGRDGGAQLNEWP